MFVDYMKTIRVLNAVKNTGYKKLDLSILRLDKELNVWEKIHGMILRNKTKTEVLEACRMRSDINLTPIIKSGIEFIYDIKNKYGFDTINSFKVELYKEEVLMNGLLSKEELSRCFMIEDIDARIQLKNPVHKYKNSLDEVPIDFDFLFDVTAKKKEFPLCIKTLQSTYGKVEEGDMVGIIAPSGTGKSFTLCCQAAELLKQGFSVTYAFTEMQGSSVLQMLYAAYVNQSKYDLKPGCVSRDVPFYEKLVEAQKTFKEKLTVKNVERVDEDSMQELFESTDSEVVILDYFEINGAADAYGTSDKFLTIASQIKRYCEEQSRVAFLAMQSNLTEKIAPLEKRGRDVVARSKQAINKFSLMVLLTQSPEDEFELRRGVVPGGVINIFTILKQRDAENGNFEGSYFHYELFNYKEFKLNPLGVKKYSLNKFSDVPVCLEDGTALFDIEKDGYISDAEDKVLQSSKKNLKF